MEPVDRLFAYSTQEASHVQATFSPESSFQDTQGSLEPVLLRYFREDTHGECGNAYASFSSTYGTARVFPSPPDGVCGAWNEKFVGVARVTQGSYLSAAVVQQDNFQAGKQEQKMSYSATGGGTATVVVPWVMKDYGWQNCSGWWTGINVQNAGSSATTATVTYYDLNGAQVASSSATVPAKSMHVFFPTMIGANGVYSAVVTTNNGQPLAVVVNHFSTDPVHGADDTYMSHAGLNR